MRASPHPTWQRSPLHRVSLPSSDTVTVSLQASTVAESGLLSQALGVKALGPLTPKTQCGNEGREGLTWSHCWKGINSPKVSPCPLPSRAFMVSALSPSVSGHRAGGHFGKGRTPGESKGLLREPPNSLTEVPHQDGPVARAPWLPQAPRAPFKGKRGSGRDSS